MVGLQVEGRLGKGSAAGGADLARGLQLEGRFGKGFAAGGQI